MKYLLALACGVSAILVGEWVRRRQQPDRVSPEWLNESKRRSWQNTYEGVSIKWPMNKIANEAGKFNRHRLRKQA